MVRWFDAPVVLDVCPVAKPRMTGRDRWDRRPAVLKYWVFCDEIRLKANLAGFSLSGAYKVIFYVPVPQSWSNKKKMAMDGQPHQQTPDLDNLQKALMDSLCPGGDSQVWYCEAAKLWVNGAGRIEVENMEQANDRYKIS